MGNCLVSAIVSTYGADEFMEECLRVLARQTIFDRVEVIVVDAASPGRERETVREFQKRYRNIKYIRTEKRVGIYAAWNIAIRSSTGSYITTFSTNDGLNRNAYEVLSRFLDQNPDVALVYGDTYLTSVPHESFEKHTRIGSYKWPDYSYEDMLQNCSVGPHPMWRRSVHDHIGYFDERYYGLGDYEFWLRMGQTYKLAHLPLYTGLFWMDEASLSSHKENSVREIADIREKYQRRYLMRLAREEGEADQGHDVMGIKCEGDIIVDEKASPGHLIRQCYRETKDRIYTQKKDLRWFFDINYVSLEWLTSCIRGIYELINASIPEASDGDADPVKYMLSFTRSFRNNISKSRHLRTNGNHSGNSDLHQLYRKIVEDAQNCECDPEKNFLISEFMRLLEELGKSLCSQKAKFKKGNEDIVSRIYRIFALVAGEALASYYLYSESLRRQGEGLKKIDGLLGRGHVC